MILSTAAGWSLERFVGWSNATVVGLFAGLIIAPMVPSKRGCALQRPRAEGSASE